MKKSVGSFVIAIMILLACVCAVCANAVTARVEADVISGHIGDYIDIPVKITDNPGLMGFKITVSYSTDDFSNPSVERGTVTSAGMFNDSIGIETNGSFDVVWSDTKETVENGTLFTIKLKVESSQIKSSSIDVAYSAPDTFNEAWQDVELNIKPILIGLNGYEITTESSSAEQTETDTDASSKTSEDDSSTTSPSEPVKLKLSEKIKKWAAGLVSPFDVIMKFLVTPLTFVISLFE